ncbi:MAG: aminotransferase class I/II-fold pyridoxal phosphate-dependent enzyme [Chloroflexi bacterium]|nr:aminotransferase class I/II-fold pyridoxal phosphate-dependent enzyme [Chloroflexota bacterium]
MSLDFVKPAERISAFKPYFFSILGKKIKDLQSHGLDVIRLDMGSPDLPPADFIIEAMVQSARSADSHGYTAYGGIPLFREAVAKYYLNRFNVKLDPVNEVLGLIGSKEGLFDLPVVLANMGDVILIPDPGYPVYQSGAELVGAEIHYVPLVAENNFLPDLKAIPPKIAYRAKIMWINYPNNPTGAVAPIEFFEEVVEFGRKHEIVIAHDAPYTEICYDGYVAPSILQVPDSKDVVVEFNSLSKAYNMGGWRLGMVCGNPKVLKLLQTYKSQMDNSHFAPIQIAGATALTGDQNWLINRNEIYKERRDIILETLRNLGFQVNTPPSTIYLWARIPSRFEDCIEFCDRLLRETGVSMTPGTVFGEYGKGYVRISLGIATDRVRVAMERLTDWMKKQ